jgi:uncharacterized protein DUF6928
MVLYADGEIRPVLQAPPPLDREATRVLVERLYPAARLTQTEDGCLGVANPPEGQIYAGCFPGLTIVCSSDVALDHPSQLDARFLAEGGGRTTYLHATHSVVDWFAYGIWAADGSLQRSLSLAPDDGIMENIGKPLAFEMPYWAGQRPVSDDDDERRYPLPFHPLELAEDALRTLFGFNYEGVYRDDDPDLAAVALAGYRIQTDATA